MNKNDLNTIAQLEQFLTGRQVLDFLVDRSKDECSLAYIQHTLWSEQCFLCTVLRQAKVKIGLMNYVFKK